SLFPSSTSTPSSCEPLHVLLRHRMLVMVPYTDVADRKGTLLDHDYRVIARKHNIEINVRAGDDIAQFPIEKARFRCIWHVIGAGTVSMVGYGWLMRLKVVS